MTHVPLPDTVTVVDTFPSVTVRAAASLRASVGAKLTVKAQLDPGAGAAQQEPARSQANGTGCRMSALVGPQHSPFEHEGQAPRRCGSDSNHRVAGEVASGYAVYATPGQSNTGVS